MQHQLSPERIAYLIAGFIRKTLTNEEHNELDRWVEASHENMRLFEELTDENNINSSQNWFKKREADQKKKQQVFENIRQRAGIKTHSLLRILLPYAVAVVIIIAASIIYFNTSQTKPLEQPAVATQTSIPPGKDQATLTLSDGRKINLDSAVKGNVADGAAIQNGEVVYSSATQEEKFNTLTVPVGGQYKVVLADGTHVWLNAQSSLHYPTAFNTTERKVELTGEAYFEVVHNSSKPFRVTISPSPNGDGRGEVEVLGTHFNVNAYSDEHEIKTTLAEGKIKLSSHVQSEILKPNQQAVLNSDGKIAIANVDASEATAWKDGLFLFRDAPIESVVSQIKRWYNIEAEYKGKVTAHFNATVSRNETLQKLLDVVSGPGGVHFTLDGRKLMIKP